MNGSEIRRKLAKFLKADRDFRAVYDYARQRYDEAPQLTAHNWEHTYRDIINAIIIGEAEGAGTSATVACPPKINTCFTKQMIA